MAIRKVTSRSWGDRIGKSVSGVLGGLTLVAAMVTMLFWNERSAVDTQRALDEGAEIVVSVNADYVYSFNEGELVHVSGKAKAGTLQDADFGVATLALRLERAVEMYQWIETSRTETKKNLGGTETEVTTYSYKQDWSRQPRDSSRFQDAQNHQNPQMVFRDQTYLADDATLGAFKIGDAVLSSVGGAQPLRIAPSEAVKVQQAVGSGTVATVLDGSIYLSADPGHPKLGDYRITYSYVPVREISVVGRQSDEGLAPYRTEAGNSLLLVQTGLVPAAEMFQTAADSNSTTTWIFRAVGLVFLIIGFATILAPIGVLASVVPFLGSIANTGTGIIAVILGTTLGSLTIATAWLLYRPITALVVVLTGLLIVLVVGAIARKRRQPGVALGESV